MNVSSASVSATYGFNAASSRLNAAASDVVSAAVQGADADLTRDVVAMDLAKFSFAASALVVRAQDQVTGTLLNLLG